MLKKMLFGGLAVALVGGAFLGRDVFSYVGTSYSRVKDTVKSSVPLEFEIDRARKLVHDLVPDIRKNMHLVAKEEVEVERLGQQIADAEARLATERAEIMRLKDDLTSGKDSFQYAGRSFSADQVRVSLASRFGRFKTQDATLASLREMRTVREHSLQAARDKLEAMLASKRQLAVEVENLEARLKMLEAKQASSAYAFDDSRLSRAKELIGDLRSRLTVEERVLNVEGNLQDDIPVSAEVPADILEQVTEYFQQSTPQPQAVAADGSL